jgi:hypothetical protein
MDAETVEQLLSLPLLALPLSLGTLDPRYSGRSTQSARTDLAALGSSSYHHVCLPSTCYYVPEMH